MVQTVKLLNSFRFWHVLNRNHWHTLTDMRGLNRTEIATGIHSLAVKFKAAIKEADGIIISFAEHNGAYSAAFKNIYDWVSRLGRDVWESKPLFLLATSPGKRGAQGVLELAHSRYKHSHKNTIATFSLPSFSQNFSADKGITDEALKSTFNEQLSVFVEALKNN